MLVHVLNIVHSNYRLCGVHTVNCIKHVLVYFRELFLEAFLCWCLVCEASAKLLNGHLQAEASIIRLPQP